MGGSIRGAFSNNERSEYFTNTTNSQNHHPITFTRLFMWLSGNNPCRFSFPHKLILTLFNSYLNSLTTTTRVTLLFTAKNFFRVSYRAGGQLQSHSFQASDAFNKQQWINCIRQAKEAAALTGDQPPQTAPCPETGPGGQIGPLGGTALSLHSGNEDEKGMWGGLEGKEGLGGGKEEGAGLSQDGETGMKSETRLTVGETGTGEVETGQGLCDEQGATADWKIDGGRGGEGATVSDDVPTFLLSPAPPPEEEEDVMGGERSDPKEEEEVGMETSEGDSMEELSLRC